MENGGKYSVEYTAECPIKINANEIQPTCAGYRDWWLLKFEEYLYFEIEN